MKKFSGSTKVALDANILPMRLQNPEALLLHLAILWIMHLHLKPGVPHAITLVLQSPLQKFLQAAGKLPLRRKTERRNEKSRLRFKAIDLIVRDYVEDTVDLYEKYPDLCCRRLRQSTWCFPCYFPLLFE